MSFEEFKKKVQDEFNEYDENDNQMRSDKELYEIYKKAGNEIDKLSIGCVICTYFEWKNKIRCEDGEEIFS